MPILSTELKTLSFEARLQSLHDTLTAFESQVSAYGTYDEAPPVMYRTIHDYLKRINDHFAIDDMQNYSSQDRVCLSIFKFIGESLYTAYCETAPNGGNKDILVLSIASMNRLVKLFTSHPPTDFEACFKQSKKDQFSRLKMHLLLLLFHTLFVSIILVPTIFAASFIPLVLLPLSLGIVVCAMVMIEPIYLCIKDLRIINHIDKLSKLGFFSADAETRPLLAKDPETSEPSSNGHDCLPA